MTKATPENINEIAELIETEHDWVLDLEQYADRDARELAAAWHESNPRVSVDEVDAWLRARVHDPEIAYRLRHTPHEKVTTWRIDPQADMLWETREYVDGYEPDELAVVDSTIGDFADTVGFKLASGLVEFGDLDDLLWPVCLATVDPDQVGDIRESLAWLRANRPGDRYAIREHVELLGSLTSGRVDLVDAEGSHVSVLTDEGIEAAKDMFPDHDFARHSFRLSDPGCRGFRYWQADRRRQA